MYHRALLDSLAQWRSQTAAAAGIPEYGVMTSTTMQAIAEQRPTAVADLSQIPGMTAVRLERYGQQILAVVARAHPAPEATTVDPGDSVEPVASADPLQTESAGG